MKPRRKNWVRKKRSKMEPIYLKLNDFEAKGAKGNEVGVLEVKTRSVCVCGRKNEVCVCGEERANRERAWGDFVFDEA